MEILLLILLLLMDCLVSIRGFNIVVKYGQIIVDGADDCTFSNFGKNYTYKSYDPNFSMDTTYLFGLIKYDCGDENAGYLNSIFECKPCIYCNYNEYVPQCSNHFIKFTVLAFFAVLFGTFGLASGIMWAVRKFKRWFNYKMLKRNDTKRMKMVKKMNKVTGIMPTKIEFKTTKGKEMEQHKLEKTDKKRKAFQDRYVSQQQQQHETTVEIYPNPLKSFLSSPLRSSPSPSPPPLQMSTTTLCLVIMIFGVLLDAASACNNTLFISSNGKMCDKDISECTYSTVTRFQIGAGKTICFKDENDDELIVHVKSLNHFVTYQRMYDTTDFAIDVVEATDECGEKDVCSKETCKLGTKHPNFREVPEKIQGYICQTSSSCQVKCILNYSCTFLHWRLRPIGNIARIYQHSGEVWEALLEIKHGKTRKEIEINVGRPGHDVDNVVLGTIGTIPIQINSFLSKTYHYPKNLIDDNNEVYEVDACEINVSIEEKVGDYQIQIDGDRSSRYKVHGVNCRTGFCTGNCTTAEPGLRVFRQKKRPKYTETKNFKRDGNDKDAFLRREITAAHMDISIGNVKVKNLDVKKAVCDIEMIQTFACTGCNQRPFIVFQANNIREPGIIKFESNCTFDLDHLSCSYVPFVLQMEKLHRYCYIYMATINKTINIEMDIESLGTIYPSIPQGSSETFTEVLTTAFGNWDTLTKFTIGFVGATIFGVVMNSLTRPVTAYFVRREILRTQTQDNNNIQHV